MNLRTISRSELAQRTKEIVHQVRQGQPAVVRSSGEDQIVLLDALDYRLLRGVADWATHPAALPDGVPEESRVMRAYLDRAISLGKAEELLGISRFELKDCFLRLQIPLRQGPASVSEAQVEVVAARKAASKAG